MTATTPPSYPGAGTAGTSTDDLGGSMPLGASPASVDPAASSIAIGDAVTSTSSTGGDKFGKVREEATRLRGEATDRARTAAATGKDKASDALDGIAQAVHDTAQKLETQAGPKVADYAHRAADALDSFSASLRNKGVDELVSDARDLVRRSPAIAVGAAVAVGFVLSRFLKATSSDRPGYAAYDNDGRYARSGRKSSNGANDRDSSSYNA